jgi:hypothetical protein
MLISLFPFRIVVPYITALRILQWSQRSSKREKNISRINGFIKKKEEQDF